MTITMSLEEAARSIPDAAHIGVGGVLMDRKPITMIAAIARAEVGNLTVSSFLASLDVELLVAGASVRRVRTGYVGFEHRGGAPLFRKAYADGAIDVESHSELTYTNGLDAAAAGLPFLPTRGAMGSDLVADLGLATVEDPYGSGELLAVAASPVDVALIHTHLADVRGVVAMPPVATFLYDADARVARAADRVIVSAERVVDRLDEPGLLTGFDVDFVVEASQGSAPLGLPGVYDTDEGWLAAYLGADDPTAFLTAWLEG